MLEQAKQDSDKPQRRRRERVRGPFPARLLSARPFAVGAKLKGFIRDFDADGLCMEAGEALPVGKIVRVAFKLPQSVSWAFRGLDCRLPARVRFVRETSREAAPYDLVMQWENPLAQTVGKAIRRHEREVGAIIVGIIAAILYMKWRTMAFFWYSPLVYVYSILIAAYFLSRFILASMHRNPELRGFTPSISLIISVRNEQDAIGRTLDTCYAADYPKGKREVLVVNDGSTDRTGEVLEEYRRK